MIPAGRGLSPGLCDACTHVKRIATRRGSVFYLCQMSYVDPAFRRYPRIPVLQCRGFEAAASNPNEEADSA